MTRFAIARQEARYCVVLTLLYFCAWYGCAYFIPASTMAWGIPLWFLTSCMIMPLLFIGLCAMMIKWLFTPITLTPYPTSSQEPHHGS